MSFIQRAISNPTAVISAILLVILFGAVSLGRLPVQMIPNVERPTIDISTSWRASAPEEVEVEILEPQEEALRGLTGLKSMEATASRGRAQIALEFNTNTELQRALIDVINRLNRVPGYPTDADEPIIFAGQGRFGGAIAWFALRPLPGNERDIASYQNFVEDVIENRIERVPGVANSDVYGGRPVEVRVTFDPYLAAALGVDIPTMANRLRNNDDTTGGFSDFGRRQYAVRYKGSYQLHELGNMVLDYGNGSPVLLRDVATVETIMADRSGVLNQNGGPSIALNAQPERDVNVLEVMEGLKIAVRELNEGPLKREGLQLTQVYDESIYVKESRNMLVTNLGLGILFAILILWFFLRKLRATLLVAIAIPVALFIAFIALSVAGRTLNIISLAGLAFAMGMVLDAAIVVLENIVRIRERGESSHDAATKGASQVSGALLASTTTTVAIFLPLMFLRDVAGQLFSDLAFTISIAVISSLIVALTVIPTAATTWLKDVTLKDPFTGFWDKTTSMIMKLTDSSARRWSWIIGLVSTAIVVSLVLFPDTDYLPQGKQNFIRGSILPPPGQSVDTTVEEFTTVVNQRFMPYLSGEAEPKIENYFMGVFGSFGFIGARASDPADVDELISIINRDIISGFPDTIAFVRRASIFSRLGGGRSIDVDIQGTDIESSFRAAGLGMGLISQALPQARVRPIPGLEFAEPELQLIPNEIRLNQAGWERQSMAQISRALGDGLFVGEYFDGSRSLDMILRAKDWETPAAFRAIPLATPNGEIIPAGELISLNETAGPDQILRVDRRRTVTLSVTPPEDMALEEVISTLRTKVEPQMRAILPEDGDIVYRGSADNKDEAIANLTTSFLLAIAILFLLMAALFRSFIDSLLAVLALPLATVGGIVALQITNLITFQPLDLMTMIGFVTLLGLVVNNAILLVHQTRASEREGLARRNAVEHAVRIRLRPILMSTLTSLFGMLPLLLIPGPGTELYRGLAAVIVGGLSVSTIFTLILLPSLLRFGEDKETSRVTMAGREINA